MIRKVDKDVYRIWKACQPFLLQAFFQEGIEMLRLKVIEYPSQEEQPTHMQKVFYFKDYSFEQMPNLIRINFPNLRDIFDQIRLTSRDNFRFDPQEGLRIGLQVGSKLRHCLFALDQAEHTYLETIEGMLWKAEREAECHQAPEQLYFLEMMQIQATNERHTQEICFLHSVIKTEREERRKAEQNFEAITSQMQAEIYELRTMNQVSKESESQPPKIVPRANQRAQLSSVICEEKAPTQMDFIQIEDDSNWLAKIEQYNAVQGLIRFKFRLDMNASSDLDHSFQRTRQKLVYRRKDEKHRQFVSLQPLNQPIGFVCFKLIRTKNHNIYVGAVLAERLKMQSTTKERDAVSYKLSGSCLWEDNVRAQEVLDQFQPTDILTMLINTHRQRIQWWKFGKLIVQHKLPYSFKDRPAHPFVNMLQEGDCIELV